MTNPNQLWIDMEKLNALYEELLWDADDELVFRIDGNRIVISNATQSGREDTLPF
jgi:hypothetical protein